MSKRMSVPAGVPCRVETYQPDPAAAAGFYAALMGWTIEDGSGVARLGGYDDGRAVAGIAPAPPGMDRAVWSMHVRVASVAEAVARVVAAGGAVVAAPEGGDVAVVTDPAGVAFCVRGDGAAGPGTVEARDVPGAWAMSALHTTAAPEQAAAFYGAALGWELAALPGTPLHTWWLPGAAVAGPPLPPETVALLAPPAPDVPPHWAISFHVADVDATCARAADLGGAVLMPPTTANDLRSAVVADPQGGVIALVGRP